MHRMRLDEQRNVLGEPLGCQGELKGPPQTELSSEIPHEEVWKETYCCRHQIDATTKLQVQGMKLDKNRARTQRKTLSPWKGNTWISRAGVERTDGLVSVRSTF
eukprot:scaffold798_cov367-Pavlova_lutheri.AAC.5